MKLQIGNSNHGREMVRKINSIIGVTYELLQQVLSWRLAYEGTESGLNQACCLGVLYNEIHQLIKSRL